MPLTPRPALPRRDPHPPDACRSFGPPRRRLRPLGRVQDSQNLPFTPPWSSWLRVLLPLLVPPPTSQSNLLASVHRTGEARRPRRPNPWLSPVPSGRRLWQQG